MPSIRKTDVALQNAEIEFAIRGGVNEFAAMNTGSANHAGAEFELHASWNNGVSYVIVDLIDVQDPAGASLAKLTGASKAGFARIPGADKIKAKRTDANAGNSEVSLTVK